MNRMEYEKEGEMQRGGGSEERMVPVIGNTREKGDTNGDERVRTGRIQGDIS